jgi:hypothetical protein
MRSRAGMAGLRGRSGTTASDEAKGLGGTGSSVRAGTSSRVASKVRGASRC